MNKIIFVQPALPNYRIDFFTRLYLKYGDNFILYASEMKLDGLTNSDLTYSWFKKLDRSKKLIAGSVWQSGVVSIKINRSDILVLSGNPRYISTMLLLLKAKIMGVKVVWWGHFKSSTSGRWRTYVRLIIMNLANAFLFYTDREVDRYKESVIGRIFNNKIIFGINNGIDASTINFYRRPYRSNQRDKSILFIGRLTDKSNLAMLIGAIRHPSLSDVTLNVIGDGDNRLNFVSHANLCGVSTKVIWHGGITDEEAISKIANTCRIFVYPGEVGLSLIHGMAYGLPTIVHDNEVKHMPEYFAFVNSACGFNFKYNSELSLIEKLIDIFKLSDAELNRMSENCLLRIEDGFTTKNMSERLFKFIDIIKDYTGR